MNREEIIDAIASASDLQHRDGREIFANRIYQKIKAGEIPGVMLTSHEVEQMMKENIAMRKAIAFAVAPGIWIQREEDIFQYCAKVWYADVLKQAITGDNNDA